MTRRRGERIAVAASAGVIAGFILAGARPAWGALSLAFEDPLTSSQTVSGESDKSVSGGDFVANGWQTTSGSSQIMITLADGFKPGDSGALELDVTNWDPVNQYSRDKHQFFNLYSRANGSKAIFTQPGCWWNIRGGFNYMTGGGAGFKFLFAPEYETSRVEWRLIQSRNDWDTSRTYTFRIEWTSSSVSIALDGQKLQESSSAFGGRSEDLKYIFIGTDNVYGAQVGPIYTGLRVYTEGGGGTPVNQPPQATITVSTLEAAVGEPLSFSATASSDPEGSIADYAWAYDDGATEGGQSMSSTAHAWGAAGSYTVTLTVTDADGATATDTVEVIISVADTAPPAISLSSVRIDGAVDDLTITTVRMGATEYNVGVGGLFGGEVVVSGSPASVQIQATDATGQSATRTVTVTP